MNDHDAPDTNPGQVHSWRAGLLASVLAAAACAGPVHSADAPAGQAPTQTFEVACTVVGPGAAGNTEAAAYFVSRLNARPGCRAVDAGAKSARAWDQPSGSAPGQPRRVSLTQVAFAEWNDWLALVFDGPGGALTQAFRRPAQRHLKSAFAGMENGLPGRNQIDRNAVIELAGDFYQESVARPAPAPRPLLRVRVGQKAEAAGRGKDADLLRATQPGLMATLSKTELDGFKALAMAALCRSGWWPTTGEAPQSLELFLERQPERYAALARFTTAKGRQEAEKDGLYPAALYEGLARLLNNLIPARTPGLDFASLDTRPVRPIGVRDTLLLVAQADALLAYDMATGLKKWALPSPEKTRYRFTSRTPSKFESLVFVHSPTLQVLDLADGRDGSMQSFAAAPHSWGFDDSAAEWVKVKARGSGQGSHRIHDLNAAGWLMVASGRRLLAYEKGALRWEHAGLSALDAGPCRLGDRVVVGSRDGHAIALRHADGQVLWTADLGERLAGPVAAAGPVAVLASLEGTLFGLRMADGQIVWKVDLGDTAVSGPFAAAQGIFLASGASRLWLINPANGQVNATRDWPAPILAAVPLVKRRGFACSDTEGHVAFLDPANLRTLRQVNLNTPLTAAVLPVGDLPRHWGTRDDVSRAAPGVVVGDENGFVYLVAVDEKEEERSADDLGL